MAHCRLRFITLSQLRATRKGPLLIVRYVHFLNLGSQACDFKIRAKIFIFVGSPYSISRTPTIIKNGTRSLSNRSCLSEENQSGQKLVPINPGPPKYTWATYWVA